MRQVLARLTQPSGWAMALMAGLCLLAYWRTVLLPFISDDYLQIHLARRFGPVSGWGDLAQDVLYRCRATSLVLTYWTERAFGLAPLAFTATSLLLHVLNTWLVYSLGAWRLIGWRISAVAALFFAVYQGHQEAVVWYAALPELLVFLFTLSSLRLWLGWVQGRRWWWYAGSLACFLMALLSKESGVVLCGLAALVLLLEKKTESRHWMGLAPFAVLACGYFALAYLAKAGHLHFNDGTFSLRAPFWMVELKSMARMFWVWGMASLCAIAWYRATRWIPLLALAGGWIAVTLLPYSFLTYMPFVPSRHTYLASAGLSLVVAAGFYTAWRRLSLRPAAMVALVVIVVAHQCAYLWTKKHGQFVERAAPTERLVEYARSADGPVRVSCFPYGFELAKLAVSMVVGEGVEVEQVPDGGLDLCGRR